MTDTEKTVKSAKTETIDEGKKTATPAEGTGASSIVDTLFDLGTEWTVYGLNAAKSALAQSARTLEKVAETLDRLARELGKKTTPPAAP